MVNDEFVSTHVRFYFKAGAYCGDEARDLPSNGCEVHLLSINTTHGLQQPNYEYEH